MQDVVEVLEDLLHKLPLLPVLILLASFLLQAAPNLQKLYHVFCGLLEAHEPVYVPGLILEAVEAIANKLDQQFEAAVDHLVILVERI